MTRNDFPPKKDGKGKAKNKSKQNRNLHQRNLPVLNFQSGDLGPTST